MSVELEMPRMEVTLEDDPLAEVSTPEQKFKAGVTPAGR